MAPLSLEKLLSDCQKYVGPAQQEALELLKKSETEIITELGKAIALKEINETQGN